jgi:predicted metalloprotease with PDZ domain
MRSLWQDFGRDFYELSANQRRGVRLNDIQRTVEQCARVNPYHMLQVALFTTKALPLNLLCLPHGLHLKYTRPTQPEFGASFKKIEQGWLIERVFTNGMAQRAGLAPQDILIAINGHAISEKPDDSLHDWKHMRSLTAHYWRDGVLQTTTLNNTITPAQIGTYRLERTDRATQSTWPLTTS